MLSHFDHVPLFATLWTVARQAPLSMGFSRQEYRSLLPDPPPRDLPDPGIEPGSLRCFLHWQAGSLLLLTPGKPRNIHQGETLKQELYKKESRAVIQGPVTTSAKPTGDTEAKAALQNCPSQAKVASLYLLYPRLGD